MFFHPIRITRTSIAYTIKCNDGGSIVENYRFNNKYEGNQILDFLDMVNQASGTSSPLALRPVARFWHQVLLLNIRPREKYTKVLTKEDNYFMFFLGFKNCINLPKTIFNYLKETILASRNQTIFLNPYGRVLYEFLIRAGIVDRVSNEMFVDALVVE